MRLRPKLLYKSISLPAEVGSWQHVSLEMPGPSGKRTKPILIPEGTVQAPESAMPEISYMNQ